MPYARNKSQVISWQALAGSSDPAARKRDLTIPLEQCICFLAGSSRIVRSGGSESGFCKKDPLLFTDSLDLTIQAEQAE
jgi:hypothetical protein